MRVDVNLSVREIGERKLGNRTEMKNLNSFKAIARAIDNERERQIKLIEGGKEVFQETRRWDDLKEVSYVMRSKENAQDYRYFPEPDLLPVFISEEWVEEIKARQPELRSDKILRYKNEYELPDYDAQIITGHKKLTDFFEETTAICKKPKKVSNWLMGETMRLLREREMEPEEIHFSPGNLAELIELVDNGILNNNVAKEVFEHIFDDDVNPKKYVEIHGLRMESNESELKQVVIEVLAANSQSVADYKNGKEKALGFLIGQSMKATGGKANPGIISKLLRELLR